MSMTMNSERRREREKKEERDRKTSDFRFLRAIQKPGENDFTVHPRRRSTAISWIVRPRPSDREFDVHREISTMLRGGACRHAGSEGRRENASGSSQARRADLRGNSTEQVFSSPLAVTLGHELRKLPPLESLPAYMMAGVPPLVTRLRKFFKFPRSTRRAPRCRFSRSFLPWRKSTNTVPIIPRTIPTRQWADDARYGRSWKRRIARVHNVQEINVRKVPKWTIAVVCAIAFIAFIPLVVEWTRY